MADAKTRELDLDSPRERGLKAPGWQNQCPIHGFPAGAGVKGPLGGGAGTNVGIPRGSGG